MKLQRFDVSDTPQITITCYGDLEITGGREGEVAIKAYGSEEDLDIQRQEEQLTITSRARCKVGCPSRAVLTVPSVNGDLRVRRVVGTVTVANAHGDTALKDVGPTTINNASGDVRVRGVQGDLHLGFVGGDLAVRGVEGRLSSDRVSGDLSAGELQGGLEATAYGDAALKTVFTPGHDYRLTVHGDATIRFPPGSSAEFEIEAKGSLTHNVDWSEIEERAGALHGRVGHKDAAAHVVIKAHGDVALRSSGDSGRFAPVFVVEDEELEVLEMELESMGEELERSIEAHMARLNAQLEAKLSHIDHEGFRKKAERARQKAERAAEKARLKAERHQRRWTRMGAQRPPASPPPPKHASEPVSDEERLTILRMVQEGKISAGEAARLLEALEG